MLAADTTTLAAVSVLHVHIAKAPFVPGLDLTLGSLVEATFTGSAAKDAVTGTQLVFYDAGDGQLTLQLKEPVGGWLFSCTADPTSPETIYGYYVTDNANAVLYGAALLPAPITVSAAGQSFDLGEINMKYSTSSPT